MPIPNRYTAVYLIGIGGISMSSLALWFHHKGLAVAGYDRNRSAMCEALEAEGIAIAYEEDTALLPAFVQQAAANGTQNHMLTIYTPAVPATSPLRAWFEANDFVLHKRAAVLGQITAGTPTVAVAGTHGKTTTSTLIAHIFAEASLPFTAFLGGISTNYGGNLMERGTTRYVVEADEFDRSFLQLAPQIAIITSTDADHLDIYGDEASLRAAFSEFARRVQPLGHLISRNGLQGLAPHITVSRLTYGPAEPGQQKAIPESLSLPENPAPDFAIQNPHVTNGKMRFDLATPNYGVLKDVVLGLPGTHNMENAAAAMAAALLCGVPPHTVVAAVGTFAGVRRRFEYRIDMPTLTYIDDYAHHPTEITRLVESVRMLYPGKRVLGIFQPHLYSRTKDFSHAFSTALSLLDDVILMPLYPARETPMQGVSSQMLAPAITVPVRLMDPAQILDEVPRLPFDVLLTIGAGSIDQLVQPLTACLLASRFSNAPQTQPA